MKRFATLTVLVLASMPALAAIAFLKSSYISGLNKICVYNHLGSDYHMTIRSHQLCPQTINLP